MCYSVCYMCNVFVLSLSYILVSGNRKCSGVAQLPGLELNNSQLLNDKSWSFFIFGPKKDYTI